VVEWYYMVLFMGEISVLDPLVDFNKNLINLIIIHSIQFWLISTIQSRHQINKYKNK